MRNIQLKEFGNLTFGILITSIFLFGCSKDLFHLPTSPQEEMEKAVEGGFDGIIVYVNQSEKSSYYSAGFNNREKQTLADPHSLFKIAITLRETLVCHVLFYLVGARRGKELIHLSSFFFV